MTMRKPFTPAYATVFALVALMVGATAVVGARQSASQQSGAKPKSPQASSQSGKPWHITFDELVHNDATGEGEATRVVATSDEDTVIKADLFTWNDKKRTARATGNLHMSDDQADGTAEQADIEYARSKKLIVLTGKVVLTLKPRKPASKDQPSAENAANGAADKASDEPGLRDYPIEVTCDRVEYSYARAKRHAVLTGNLRAVQKLKDHTRTLTADRAEWFGAEEKAILYGPVRVEDTKGRKGETPEDVIIHTREGQESIKMRKGVYTMPMEDEDKPQQQPPDRTQPPAEQGRGR